MGGVTFVLEESLSCSFNLDNTWDGGGTQHHLISKLTSICMLSTHPDGVFSVQSPSCLSMDEQYLNRSTHYLCIVFSHQSRPCSAIYENVPMLGHSRWHPSLWIGDKIASGGGYDGDNGGGGGGIYQNKSIYQFNINILMRKKTYTFLINIF